MMGQLFATSDAFRSARDSWWSARLSAKDSKFSQGSRIAAKAARKEERWRLYGKSYLRYYKGLDGQLIRFPPELAGMIEKQIESVAPKLARAMDARLGRVAMDAWENWPVSTGLSKSLLDIEYEQKGTTFVGRVVSRAPYTVFVRKGQTYRDLLKVPGRAAAFAILDDVAKDDGKGGGGGV